MTEQVISEVLSRWDLIADGLMALSPKVYEIYVRQAFWVKGAKGTIAGSLFSTILGVVFVWCVFGLRKNSGSSWEDQEMFAGGVVFSAIGLVVSLIFLICSIGYLMNPEYYAIQKILKTLFGK